MDREEVARKLEKTEALLKEALVEVQYSLAEGVIKRRKERAIEEVQGELQKALESIDSCLTTLT